MVIKNYQARSMEKVDQNPHVSALDALRGLAAATVVFLHALSMFWGTQHAAFSVMDEFQGLFFRTPVSIFWAGNSAVALFFILSGFALERMISSNHSFQYSAYLIRRTFRLWVPYAASLVVGLALLAVAPPLAVDWQSPWFNSLAADTPSPENVLAHLLLIGDFDIKPINFVVWSLVHEMRMSLVFPLIHLIMHSRWRFLLILTSALLSGITLILQKKGVIPDGKANISFTAVYQFHFVAGAVLSIYQTSLRAWYTRLPVVMKLAMFLITIAIYANIQDSLYVAGLIGGGGIILVALCSATVQRSLNQRQLQWLGNISYSLYLYHAMIILCLVKLFSKWPELTPYVVAFGVIIAFGVAYVSYALVEVPANTMGKEISWRLRHGRGVAPRKL